MGIGEAVKVDVFVTVALGCIVEVASGTFVTTACSVPFDSFVHAPTMKTETRRNTRERFIEISVVTGLWLHLKQAPCPSASHIREVELARRWRNDLEGSDSAGTGKIGVNVRACGQVIC